MKSPVILRIFKNSQLVEVKQFLQDQVVIGRQGDVQVALDDEKVSPIHCMVEFREEKYYLCDLGSASGTFKNGQAVLDESLDSGDEITVGPYKMVFFVGVPKPKVNPTASDFPMGQVASPEAPVIAPPVAPVVEVPPTAPKKDAPAPPAAKPAAPVAKPVEPKPAAPKVNIPLSAPAITAETPVSVAKPIIRSPVVSSSTHALKSKGKTFAPPSAVTDLKTYLSVTKGPVAEVIVAWQERILSTQHYRASAILRANDLDLPPALITGTLIEIKQGIRIYIPAGADFSLVTETTKLGLDQVKGLNRLQNDARGNFVRIEQGEVGFLELGGNSKIQIIARYVPGTAIVPLIPPLMLSAGEVSGLVFSIVLVGLVAFLVNILAPVPVEKTEEELTRVAQVVFQNPPKRPAPPPPEQIPPTPPEPKPPVPTPPPVKAVVKDEVKEVVRKGKPAEAAKNNQSAGRAAEVAPKPDSKNKPKIFTSTKQGGAVKLGATAGANAQSAKDVTKTGLFSAFGNEGVRKEIDKAYSGAGELMGNADKASGSSGFNENRAGDDLGSRFKDTGAGGKGTATQGIAGVGTKGRSSGMAGYGNDFGTGEKSSVAVISGGAEEDFVGTIDREAVRRAVRSHKNEIEGCYTKVLNRLDRNQRKALEGKVVLSWDIVERGQARNVAVRDTTLHNKEVEECVRQRLATWQFPEPPAGMTATVQSYPFYFRSQN
ncbi:MAG: AgmX/PglI C-terminal domain-containing protein [Bdellovibrionota bacterium]